MALTKAINSKANIKQYSSADYPINPRQPVIAKYDAESTASQTVINLPWSVDTVNAQDSFFLAIDGKILTLGASNDYTMTSIDALGFSSQVTLDSAIIAGLNIQAWKLGLKKETELLLTTIDVASNATLMAYTINLVDTSAARSLTLPSPARNTRILVKDSTGSAGANNITVTPSSGNIDGAGSDTINTNYGYREYVANGTNWFKIR